MKRFELSPVIAKTMVLFSKLALRIVRPRARVYGLARMMELLDPRWVTKTPYGKVEFYCPASWPYTRSNMKKERDTYRWIDGFKDGDIFWDIGSNVGVFSLYAAKKGHSVFSFEPAAINYFVQVRNIELNNFSDKITALNIAVHNENKISYLSMPHTNIGGAQHTFDANRKSAEPASASVFKQAVLGYRMDELIKAFSVEVPTHIKIDVDGNEDKVIEGALELISNPKLKSIMLEICPEKASGIISHLTKAGFHISFHKEGSMNHFFER